MPCQTSDIVSAALAVLHDTSGKTWREIAALPQYSGIPAGTLCAIAKGATIPVKHRVQLGLPAHIPTPACPECGEVHTKGHPHAEQRSPRLIAAVSAEQKRAVSEAAKAAGMTEARWIRVRLGLEE